MKYWDKITPNDANMCVGVLAFIYSRTPRSSWTGCDVDIMKQCHVKTDLVEKRRCHNTQPTLRHETLTQCWVDAGPPPSTLAQHQPTIGSTFRVMFWWLGCMWTLLQSGNDEPRAICPYWSRGNKTEEVKYSSGLTLSTVTCISMAENMLEVSDKITKNIQQRNKMGHSKILKNIVASILYGKEIVTPE